LSNEQLQALLPSLEQLDRELIGREGLKEYVRAAWAIVEPSTSYLHNWHIDMLCEYLEAVSNRQILRLIINIPPRYMKSLLTSVFWPTYTWTIHPHTRWLFASYAQSVSTRDSVKRRDLVSSQWYRSLWGDKVTIAKDQNQKTEFQNTAKGYMMSSSVGASITGAGGDYIVIDDPLDPKQALSDIQRDTANRWIDQTISTRLNDKRRGVIVLIMQRLHERDVTGHLLSKKDDTGVPDWHHVSVPAEATKKTTIQFPVSKTKVERNTDDLLWPQKEDREILDRQKRAMGSYAYAGQYQQSPAPLEGGLFKKQWWRFYQPSLLPQESVEQLVQSWDMSFKSAQDNSFVVGQVWARVGVNRFLLDQVRFHGDFPKTVQAVVGMKHKWPHSTAILIEDKANGPAVISTLNSTIQGIIAITPKGSKEARAAAVSYQVEAGNIQLPNPEDCPWVEEFMLECEQFPNAEHDDQCFVAGTKISTLYGDKPIEKVRIGDKVITPFGIRRVIDAGCTGERYVKFIKGLKGTENHPTFVHGSGFIPLNRVLAKNNVSKLSFREVFRWRFLRLWNSMDLSIPEDGDRRLELTIIDQQKIDQDLKHCMWKFGSILMEKKLQESMRYIIKTTILLITTLVTLSVYQGVNIGNCILLKIKKSSWCILKRFESWLQNGINQKKAESGIKTKEIMEFGIRNLIEKLFVYSVKMFSYLNHLLLSIAPINVDMNIGKFAYQMGNLTSQKNASFAEKNLLQEDIMQIINGENRAVIDVPNNLCLKQKVYNLTVEKDHMYYANGILVSNCDAMTQVLSWLPQPNMWQELDLKEAAWMGSIRSTVRETPVLNHINDNGDEDMMVSYGSGVSGMNPW